MKIQFSFDLVEDLVASPHMEFLACARALYQQGNVVRTLPDNSHRPSFPILAVGPEIFFHIEILKERNKHNILLTAAKRFRMLRFLTRRANAFPREWFCEWPGCDQHSAKYWVDLPFAPFCLQH